MACVLASIFYCMTKLKRQIDQTHFVSWFCERHPTQEPNVIDVAEDHNVILTATT